MQEDVTAHPDGTITIDIPAEPGEFIRRAGADVCAGQRLAEAGQRITPALAGCAGDSGLGKRDSGRQPKGRNSFDRRRTGSTGSAPAVLSLHLQQQWPDAQGAGSVLW